MTLVLEDCAFTDDIIERQPESQLEGSSSAYRKAAPHFTGLEPNQAKANSALKYNIEQLGLPGWI